MMNENYDTLKYFHVASRNLDFLKKEFKPLRYGNGFKISLCYFKRQPRILQDALPLVLRIGNEHKRLKRRGISLRKLREVSLKKY